MTTASATSDAQQRCYAQRAVLAALPQRQQRVRVRAGSNKILMHLHPSACTRLGRVNHSEVTSSQRACLGLKSTSLTVFNVPVARTQALKGPRWLTEDGLVRQVSSKSHAETQRSTIRAAVLYRLERHEWLRTTSKFGLDNASRRGMHSEGLRASHTNTLTIRIPWERYVHACQTMKISTITSP